MQQSYHMIVANLSRDGECGHCARCVYMAAVRAVVSLGKDLDSALLHATFDAWKDALGHWRIDLTNI